MRICKLFRDAMAVAVALLLGAEMQPAQAQQSVRFNADYAIRDVRVDYGVCGAVKNNFVASDLFQVSYSQLFWRRFAWKAGAVFVTNPGGFQSLVGAPIGLAYRTFTIPVENALGYAVEESVYDAVTDAVWGYSDRIGGHILANLLWALVRRSEFFIGVTPCCYLGVPSIADNVQTFSRFALTGDLGFSLSIPIWRFSINFTPAYHYSFIRNYEVDGITPRHLITFTAGLGFLF